MMQRDRTGQSPIDRVVRAEALHSQCCCGFYEAKTIEFSRSFRWCISKKNQPPFSISAGRTSVLSWPSCVRRRWSIKSMAASLNDNVTPH